MATSSVVDPPVPVTAPEPAAPAAHPWLTALSVLAGTFMVVLDSTVVNVSLPHIAGNLSSTVEETTWALTSYLTANAIILPITGWLANFLGRKRLLLFSVSGFTMASVLCGLAPTLPALILFRIVQGTSGGLMQPLSQAVMLESFPPRKRGEAMALWGVGIVVAPILGPVLGGWLTENYTWRWIFFVNIPVGVTAILMIRAYVFDPPYIKRPGSIDFWGIGLLAVSIGSLQIALDRGEKDDWLASGLIVALLISAVLALVVLIAHEWKARSPVVDLHMLRDRTYAAGLALATLMGFVLYGSLVLLPILLQTLLGYPPLEAGITMAPRGLGTLLVTPVIGWLVARVDPRKPLAFGFLLGAWTLYRLGSLNFDAGYWDFFWPQLIQGMAFGMLFVPLTTTTMSTMRNEQIGAATSLFNLVRNIGGSAGIAVTETLLQRRQAVHVNAFAAHITPYDAQARAAFQSLRQMFAAAGDDAATATSRAYATIGGLVQRQAAMLSFLDGFRVLALAFLFVIPLVFVMRRPVLGRSAGPAGAD